MQKSPLSLAFARQLPQRGSHWQAGPLPTGRLRPDKAQKGGPCLRGQRFLDKRALSSCRWPRQRSTTVPEKIRLCSSRVGLTGTPEAPLLGELAGASPTERLDEGRPDREALARLNLSVTPAACHLPYRGEALAYRKASPLRQRLPLWGSCHRR